MTEVERYVRDAVARTGEPFLLVPKGVRFVNAVPVWMMWTADPGVYVLARANRQPETPSAWATAASTALAMVEEWVPDPPDDVEYAYEEGLFDSVREARATALGLSLLQLALNRAGSGLAIHVVAPWCWRP